MIEGYLEIPDKQTLAALDHVDYSELRKDVFGSIIDQGYPGSKLEDISLIPRIIPRSHMERIEEACKNLTGAILALASKNKEFLLKHLHPDSRWEKLIHRHGVLDSVPRRMIGELRYDFALCGPLTEDNPPLVMEVNAGALGGVVYASLIPKIIKQHVPNLDHLSVYDLSEHFVHLCRRIGPHIANFSVGEYSWGESVLADYIREKVHFHMVTPVEISDIEYWPGLKRAQWSFDQDKRLRLLLDGHWQAMDGFRWSRILEHNDIDRFGALLEAVGNGPTTYISPLRMDYVCHKGILPLLFDANFLSQELGIQDTQKVLQHVIPCWQYSNHGFPPSHERKNLVLKQNFGCSGKKVFVGHGMDEMNGKIYRPEEWVIQKKVDLNQMFSRLMYSQDRPVRMDLGVFVHYDYVDGRLEYCKVTGMLCRGSQRYKVNLNLGGACIPVLVNDME
ncbi:MAG: hypothetical protein JEZ02_08800 [Desulfatibacillum sp.]|nr:hypothetical protein [Desulfatibacillum sp.]